VYFLFTWSWYAVWTKEVEDRKCDYVLVLNGWTYFYRLLLMEFKFSRDIVAVRCCSKYFYVVWNVVLFPPPPLWNTSYVCEALDKKCLHIISRNSYGANKITGSCVMRPFLLLNILICSSDVFVTYSKRTAILHLWYASGWSHTGKLHYMYNKNPAKRKVQLLMKCLSGSEQI
jgi:hypothetical protein